MVCKDELCASFKNLHSAERIELICGMLQLCVPLELRFIGSCLEELARKDYASLKDFEERANDSGSLRAATDSDPLTKDVCGTFNVYMSLLHSDNSICAHVLFKLLTRLTSTVENTLQQFSEHKLTFDCEMVDDIVLLFTMASHHPAFSFSQRLQLDKDCKMLKDLLGSNYSVNNIPLEIVQEAENKPSENEDGFENGGGMLNRNDGNSLNNTTIDQDLTVLNVEPESVWVKEIRLKNLVMVEGKHGYNLEVGWSDDEVTQVTKTYHELSDFHRQLIHLFPEDSGAYKQERNLPFFPQEKNRQGTQLIDLMKEYFRKITALPENFVRCELMTSFLHGERAISSSSSVLLASSSAAASSSTATLTMSNSQQNISNRNGIAANNESSSKSVNTEEEQKPRVSHVRSLTVYNSHLSDHSNKRDMAGKPLRPHLSVAASKSAALPTLASTDSVARTPWLNSQNLSSTIDCARLFESHVINSPPSTTSCQQNVSPNYSEISPLQSAASGSSGGSSDSSSSPVELSQSSKEDVQDSWSRADTSNAILCSAEALGVTGLEPNLQQMDAYAWLLNSSNNGIQGAGGGYELVPASSSECIPIVWCPQPPIADLNATLSKGIPPGTPMSLVAVPYYPQPALAPDDISQDKTFEMPAPAAELCSTAGSYAGGSERYGKHNNLFPIAPRFAAMKRELENQGYGSAVARQPYLGLLDPMASQCFYSSLGANVVGVSSLQLAAPPKAARPILGAGVASSQNRSTDDNGRATVRDVNDAYEASPNVGRLSPTSVDYVASARPTSLNVRRSKNESVGAVDSKATSHSSYRISGSHSVAAVSSVAVGDANPTRPAYSTSSFVPTQMMLQQQRVSNLPLPPPPPPGSRRFSMEPPPSPSASSQPPIPNVSATSSFPTPSTTPPVLAPPPPPGIGSSGGVGVAGGSSCATCCPCLQCSTLQATVPGLPYGYPIIWPPAHGMYPASAFGFNVNGFVQAQNMSYPPPPPSLPPMPPLHHYNGLNSETIYNISQGFTYVQQQHQPQMNHPQMMPPTQIFSAPCVPFHPNVPPPGHVHGLPPQQSAVSKVAAPPPPPGSKSFCANCGGTDHPLNACTETKMSYTGQTGHFRLNPASSKQTSND